MNIDASIIIDFELVSNFQLSSASCKCDSIFYATQIFLTYFFVCAGTQQAEDPREVWQGGKHNMIKQYLELTQNDLTVSKIF